MSVVVKIDYQGQVKRLNHPPNNFQELQKVSAKLVNGVTLDTHEVDLSYKDDDGDVINVSNQDDYMAALDWAQG